MALADRIAKTGRMLTLYLKGGHVLRDLAFKYLDTNQNTQQVEGIVFLNALGGMVYVPLAHIVAFETELKGKKSTDST